MSDGEVFTSNYAKLRAPEIKKPLRLPTASDTDLEGDDVLHIVWFKRDLRLYDHEVLHRVAACRGPILLLYILEPELWKGRDTSERQFLFLQESMLDLDAQVRHQFGDNFLIVRVGQAVTILDKIVKSLGFKKNALWSHQETWNLWTYERDKQVKRWCRDMAVAWQEPSQNGVLRKLQSRTGWAEKWQEHMNITRFLNAPQIASHRFQKLQTDSWPGLAMHSFSSEASCIDIYSWWSVDDGKSLPCPGRQRGGRNAAIHLLDTFLHRRGQWYQREMSSPITAWESCSRLSSHLAFGTLSLREVFQRVESRRAEVASMVESERPSGWALSLLAVSSRLRWHCHFIQKLEDEPELEYRNMHPAYDGMRTERVEDMSAEEKKRLEAWKSGTTGYTIVDAVMRALISTGWVNFRMRAMLVSFASFHLFLHWREPALWMAKLFVDYEPGIHFCQFQMQAGTTGMNTIRCYSPHKQAYDQDPDGLFIRRWVRELKHTPQQWIHEPHLVRGCSPSARARYQTKSNSNSKAVPAVRGKSVAGPISSQNAQLDRMTLGVDHAYMIGSLRSEDAVGSGNGMLPRVFSQASFAGQLSDGDCYPYPNPIVDEKEARKFALDKIFAVRRKKETIEATVHVAFKHGSRRPQSEENPKRFKFQSAGGLKGFGENLDRKRPRKRDRRIVAQALLPGQVKLSFPSHLPVQGSEGASSSVKVSTGSSKKETASSRQPTLVDFLGAHASTKRPEDVERTVEGHLLHEGVDARSGEIITIDLSSSSDCDEAIGAQQEAINLSSHSCSNRQGAEKE